ncbi:peptidoglycan-binding protein [Fischerella major NIES-592]|uniref:Peptidoglycan-binding protein n=1 Tax=Fischerella major NIES-592 TaxID=210994 RepID=A0A1U7GYA4_9CYAN|nr:peptidoglycan-binding protein [Fischerella major]OKH13380.1 peptidoglycan-binding protein [Fischerella major NIES-592]
MSDWNRQESSISAKMRLLSVALTLAFLNTAGQALALERGNSGPQVTSVQRCLQRLGYYNGPINGNFGPLTENAVKTFQRAKKIPAIGQVGPQTQRALQAACQPRQSKSSSSNVIKVGSRGAAVTQLQQSLRTLGYYKGPVTGYFGQETEQAVIRFQQSKKLQADGVVGANTLQVIRTNLASRPNNHSVGGGTDKYPNALNEGDAGPQVLQLQRNLAQLGYFQANPTGNFGSVTKDAVVRFQRDYGLTANGIVDGQTWTAISTNANYANNNNSACSPTSGFICLGENSPRVVAVQQSLRQQGFFNREITGYYGTETRDAVAKFQQTAGLNPTGFVDFQTWQALGLTNNNSTGGENPNIENRYVVIVPIRDANTLEQVRQFVPQAFAVKSRLGDYVNAGAFGTRPEAERRSSQLRDRGFDARVEYF